MRSKTSNWLEVKVRYERIVDEGTSKKVTESFIVSAITFAEAEERIISELQAFTNDDIEIQSIKKVPFKEIHFSDCDSDDRYFKATLKYITIDEKTEKEKLTRVIQIVQAEDIQKALDSVNSIMASTMIEYKTPSISDTNYVDVFE